MWRGTVTSCRLWKKISERIRPKQMISHIKIGKQPQFHFSPILPTHLTNPVPRSPSSSNLIITLQKQKTHEYPSIEISQFSISFCRSTPVAASHSPSISLPHPPPPPQTAPRTPVPVPASPPPPPSRNPHSAPRPPLPPLSAASFAISPSPHQSGYNKAPGTKANTADDTHTPLSSSSAAHNNKHHTKENSSST